MLRNLQITGFKAIRDANLSFGRVNLFIGANGAGKSTVLEAIGLLSAALVETTDVALQRRGVRLSAPIMFKSSFKNERYLQDIGLDGTFDGGVAYRVKLRSGAANASMVYFTEYLALDDSPVIGRSQNGITVDRVPMPKDSVGKARGSWNAFGASIANRPVLRRELDQFEKYAIYAPQTGFLRGVETETLPTQPIGLMGDGLPSALERVVSRLNDKTNKNRELERDILQLIWAPGWARQLTIGDFDASTVSRQVRTGQKTLYLIDKFMREGRNRLSAYDSSEGTLFLCFIVALLLHPDAPKIFAIDNVDNALNPRITTLLLKKIIDVSTKDVFKKTKSGLSKFF